jgi:hypothetical protein
MPTWGAILKEIQTESQLHPGAPPHDRILKKYLVQLHACTGRNVILYATRWVQGGVMDGQLVSIVPEDVHALMEVVHGLDPAKGLDLILHSPGGSPEAAEAMVHYLRSKFADIRVIVPQAAMSAATMLSCAANSIVMGGHSSLGPIDPQMILAMPTGTIMAPAQAIIDQFESARLECQDPKNLGAWIPILPQYGPALLQNSRNALALAEQLAAEWLRTWMFKDAPDGATKAASIAKALADHKEFKSHGRPIHREAAEKMGLVVVRLEDDQQFQDLTLSVFHTMMHIFAGMPAVAKIVQNHLGNAFVKLQGVPMPQFIQLPGPPGGAPIAPGARPQAPPTV